MLCVCFNYYYYYSFIIVALIFGLIIKKKKMYYYRIRSLVRSWPGLMPWRSVLLSDDDIMYARNWKEWARSLSSYLLVVFSRRFKKNGSKEIVGFYGFCLKRAFIEFTVKNIGYFMPDLWQRSQLLNILWVSTPIRWVQIGFDGKKIRWFLIASGVSPDPDLY